MADSVERFTKIESDDDDVLVDMCLLYSFHRRNRQFLILVVLWVSGRETVREEYYYMVKHCGESYWHMSHA